MFFDFSRYRYYVKVGATDMRCGAVGLAYRVREHMNLDVLSKSMFLFCSRDRSMLKVLVWDDGFWLMTKRLSGGTFRWPLTERDSLEVSLDDIKRLLGGQDVFRRLAPVEGKWAF